MRPRALVVDDDPEIIRTVGDILDSLNHDYDPAGDQESARKLLASDKYAYVLLDLEIPVKPGRLRRIENGKNLLAQIRETSGMDTVPIIVMTGRGNDSPDLAVAVLKNGAVDYVKKPFDKGELDKAIQEALAKGGTASAVPAARAKAVPKKLTSFKAAKREMIIYPDRVTVCGLEVWKDCAQPDLRKALIALNKKENKRFVRLRGAKIDKDLGRNASNPIARRIKDFRDHASEVLQGEGYECGQEDILASVRGGYCFTDWMDVRIAGSSAGSKIRREPAVDGREPAREPDEPGDEPLNERQQWVLAQIDKGERLRIKDIVRYTKKNRSTVNRDLKELREQT